MQNTYYYYLIQLESNKETKYLILDKYNIFLNDTLLLTINIKNINN